MRNKELIRHNINNLVRAGFDVESANDYSWVCVRGIDLPGSYGSWTLKGLTVTTTSALIDMPFDFPMSPPGVGISHPTRAIHLPLILYNGKLMNDFYMCKHDPWYWFCFQQMSWDSRNDNLLTLVALIEASISDRVRGLM
ncbi:hypothetical protein C6A37_01175 [Desulfobacteraceae bacterium SEEP-SAG9]|nr:hypothetical protein C6A37_01175 [Desulfobacteraceae bacterium SEEP-SAG9]